MANVHQRVVRIGCFAKQGIASGIACPPLRLWVNTLGEGRGPRGANTGQSKGQRWKWHQARQGSMFLSHCRESKCPFYYIWHTSCEKNQLTQSKTSVLLVFCIFTLFRHARVSSTYPSKMSVRPLVRWSVILLNFNSISVSGCSTWKVEKSNPQLFLDAQASLAPTHVCPSVGKSYFWISILSVFLVALREKLKREDPNYF